MAGAEVYANDALATVTIGGTTAPAPGTQETWTVQISQAFPAAATGAAQFHVCDAATGMTFEKFLVTNGSGAVGAQTWTVTRGAEGTTPVAHAAGFTIRQVVTAGVLAGATPLWQAINSGEITMPRGHLGDSPGGTPGSGTIVFNAFRARTSGTYGHIQFYTGGTNQATPTNNFLGLYSTDSPVNPANYTLMSASATFTWPGTFSQKIVPLGASQTLTPGNIYVIAMLQVAGTVGSVVGGWWQPGFWGTTPLITASLAGQTSLPSTQAVSGLGGITALNYYELVA